MKKDYGSPISSGSSGFHNAESGLIPPSEPTFPGKATCKCIAPRIYSGGKISETCERCGLPHGKGRSR